MKGNVVKRNLRFAIIPKVVHPWFDEVKNGAIVQQTHMIFRGMALGPIKKNEKAHKAQPREYVIALLIHK